MAVVSLDEAKAQLNVTDTVDDALIARLIVPARAHVENLLGFEIDADAPPDALKQAILMLVAHWYENREASLVGINAQETPDGVTAITNEYRNWSF